MTGRGNASIVQIADIQLARHQSELGDFETAIAQMDQVLDVLFDSGAMLWRGPATSVLVEALLSSNGAGDVDAAHAAIDRLAAVPTDAGYVLHDIPLLRLRALLARAEGSEDAYRRFSRALSSDGRVMRVRRTPGDRVIDDMSQAPPPADFITIRRLCCYVTVTIRPGVVVGAWW